uniref:Uncharacterized protein n=1 Tax=Brassica oleracea TaxID=3712 RepID=A0A3P6G5N0_BRAOL|nr:unnamed protein product [Brassica oleracea]
MDDSPPSTPPAVSPVYITTIHHLPEDTPMITSN